jgi:hypothetical protein
MSGVVGIVHKDRYCCYLGIPLAKTNSSISAMSVPAKSVLMSSAVLLSMAWTRPSAPYADGCTGIIVAAAADRAPLLRRTLHCLFTVIANCKWC